MENQTFNFTATREFSMASVLSRTFSTLSRNPVVYFGLPFLAVIPAGILGLLFGSGVGAWLGAFIAMIFGLVIQGAIAYAVYQGLKGNVAPIGDALRLGLNRIGTIILATILVGLCVGLGTVLLVVPGIIVNCMLAVTIQACVIERLGATDGMSRSAELTKGYRLQIFILVLLVTIGSAVIQGTAQHVAFEATGNSNLADIVSSLAGLIPVAFSSVMYAIVYYDLRMVKEGASLDTLANVFD